jgi:hypothetical protein
MAGEKQHENLEPGSHACGKEENPDAKMDGGNALQEVPPMIVFWNEDAVRHFLQCVTPIPLRIWVFLFSARVGSWL